MKQIIANENEGDTCLKSHLNGCVVLRVLLIDFVIVHKQNDFET